MQPLESVVDAVFVSFIGQYNNTALEEDEIFDSISELPSLTTQSAVAATGPLLISLAKAVNPPNIPIKVALSLFRDYLVLGEKWSSGEALCNVSKVTGRAMSALVNSWTRAQREAVAQWITYVSEALEQEVSKEELADWRTLRSWMVR